MIWRRRDRPILLALAASLPRWPSLNLGYLPSCSFRILSSSLRYSITWCWLRLTQPAIQMRKNSWFTAAESARGFHLAIVSAAAGQEPWKQPNSGIRTATGSSNCQSPREEEVNTHMWLSRKRAPSTTDHAIPTNRRRSVRINRRQEI
jgi:hypothetical protein